LFITAKGSIANLVAPALTSATPTLSVAFTEMLEGVLKFELFLRLDNMQ
jgi:hypothetical protein